MPITLVIYTQIGEEKKLVASGWHTKVEEKKDFVFGLQNSEI